MAYRVIDTKSSTNNMLNFPLFASAQSWITISEDEYSGSAANFHTYTQNGELTKYIKFKANTSYTFRFLGKGATATGSLQICVKYTDGTGLGGQVLASTEFTEVTITSDDTKTVDFFWISYYNGINVTIKEVMISEGTQTYVDYAPTYRRTVASSKNLIKASSDMTTAVSSGLQAQTFVDESIIEITGTSTSSDAWLGINNFSASVDAGKTYTISIRGLTYNDTSHDRFNFYLNGSTRIAVQARSDGATASTTFTASSSGTVASSGLVFGTNSGTTTLQIQLEEGSTFTPFVPAGYNYRKMAKLYNYYEHYNYGTGYFQKYLSAGSGTTPEVNILNVRGNKYTATATAADSQAGIKTNSLALEAPASKTLTIMVKSKAVTGTCKNGIYLYQYSTSSTSSKIKEGWISRLTQTTEYKWYFYHIDLESTCAYFRLEVNNYGSAAGSVVQIDDIKIIEGTVLDSSMLELE